MLAPPSLSTSLALPNWGGRDFSFVGDDDDDDDDGGVDVVMCCCSICPFSGELDSTWSSGRKSELLGQVPVAGGDLLQRSGLDWTGLSCARWAVAACFGTLTNGLEWAARTLLHHHRLPPPPHTFACTTRLSALRFCALPRVHARYLFPSAIPCQVRLVCCLVSGRFS